jgi:hypothetical protein
LRCGSVITNSSMAFLMASLNRRLGFAASVPARDHPHPLSASGGGKAAW